MDTMTKDTQLFLLTCGPAKSSWTKTQALLFDRCRNYDRHLFTRGEVDVLAQTLRRLSAESKKPVDVKGPDWEFFDRYGTRPGLVFGDNCYVTFIPVAGFFQPLPEVTA